MDSMLFFEDGSSVLEPESMNTQATSPACPFCHSIGEEQVLEKAFWLREVFEDGTVYNGYSLGNREYHEFLPECLHLHTSIQRPSLHFLFAVNKTPDTMELDFYSSELFYSLYTIVKDFDTCWNGLSLLKVLPELEQHLSAQADATTHFTARLSNLNFFVKDFLQDIEVFLSFGLTNLYEKGYLNQEQWKALQHARFEIAINALEDSCGDCSIEDTSDEILVDVDAAPWPKATSSPSSTVLSGSDLRQYSKHLINQWADLCNNSSPEHALYKAIEARNSSKVHLMLRTANKTAKIVGFDGSFDLDKINHSLWGCSKRTSPSNFLHPTPSHPFPDEYWRMTILMRAVMSRDKGIVQALINYGVDVDVVTPSGTALSIAAILNCPGIIDLLITAGADVHVALLSTKKYYSLMKLSPEEVDHQVREISNRLNHPMHRSSQYRIRCLRNEFFNEHKSIREWSRRQRMPLSFPDDIVDDRRVAWSTGVNVFRKIARGDVSHNIHEVIMFLSIVKSFCTIKDAGSWYNYTGGWYNDEVTYMNQFENDLNRWQLLFANDELKVIEYRLIVKRLWNVKVTEWESVPPSGSAAYELKVRAEILFANTISFFELETHGLRNKSGFLAGQEQWRQNMLQQSPCNVVSKESEYLANAKPPDKEAEGIGVADTGQWSERGLVPNGQDHSANMDPSSLILILMAGAILGILIALLIELATLPSKFCRVSQEQPMFHTSVTTHITRLALAHIITVLKTTNLLPLATIEFLRIEGDKIKPSNYFSSFSSLISWLEELVSNLPLETTVIDGFRSYIRAFKDNWTSTYEVQTNFHLLEIYLGFKNYTCIVPHTLLREDSSLLPETPVIGGDFIERGDASHLENYSTQSIAKFTNVAPASSSNFFSLNTQDYGTFSFPTSPPDASPSMLSSAQNSANSMSSTPQSIPQSSSSNLTTNDSPAKLACDICKKLFPNRGNLNRHRKDKHEKVRFPCRVSACDRHFSRHGYRQVHERDEHNIWIRGR